MTSESDFQDALDGEPHNHHLRLVFADWLEERGDPRAMGYRAMGAIGVFAYQSENWVGFTHTGNSHIKAKTLGCDFYIYHALPPDWFGLASGYDVSIGWYELRRVECTVRQMEDRMALAFSRLPPERQAELLAVPVLVGDVQ